jgi:ABC-type glycerol-3-phosphate transport system substrate-binding protein
LEPAIYSLTRLAMRYLLVTLGVLALVFAGCGAATSSTPVAEEELEMYSNNEPDPDFDDTVQQTVTIDTGDTLEQSVTIKE